MNFLKHALLPLGSEITEELIRKGGSNLSVPEVYDA